MKSLHRLLWLIVISGGLIFFAVEARSKTLTIQDTAPVQQPAMSNFFTGTYREKDASDQALIRKIMEATARLEPFEREGQSRALIRILRASSVFAIEQYGTTITINYPDGKRTPFEADGKPRIFRATGNETVNVRADLTGYRLTIDFTWSGGERLRMIYEKRSPESGITFTRSASNAAVPVPVSIVSEYERFSPKAMRRFTLLAKQ